MARRFKVKVNGKEYIVEVEEIRESGEGVKMPIVDVPRSEKPVKETTKTTVVEEKPQASTGGSGNVVKAPMAGVVVKVLVKEGQKVSVGDKLLIFEAMKMENELVSEVSGVVKEIKVKEGDHVETGQILMVIE